MKENPLDRVAEEVWLLNAGFVSDHSEQNLTLYGYLSAPGVMNVEMMIDVLAKKIDYAIVLDPTSHRRYKLQRWLERKVGLLAKLALLCFLRMFGSYDPAARIARCIKDYAGPSWKTSVEVLGVKQYLKVVDGDRAKGWFFKDGIDESPGVRRQDGPSSSTTTSS